MTAQDVFVVDVWGGPDAPLNCWRARYLRPLEEALAFVRMELEQGYVTNVYSQRWSGENPDEMEEFDYRVAGTA